MRVTTARQPAAPPPYHRFMEGSISAARRSAATSMRHARRAAPTLVVDGTARVAALLASFEEGFAFNGRGPGVSQPPHRFACARSRLGRDDPGSEGRPLRFAPSPRPSCTVSSGLCAFVPTCEASSPRRAEPDARGLALFACRPRCRTPTSAHRSGRVAGAPERRHRRALSPLVTADQFLSGNRHFVAGRRRCVPGRTAVAGGKCGCCIGVVPDRSARAWLEHRCCTVATPLGLLACA